MLIFMKNISSTNNIYGYGNDKELNVYDLESI